MKLREFDDPESPNEFGGNVVKEKIIQAFDKFELAFFHDGYHEFMVRIPEHGDNVAFDDHGLVFIYSNEDYSGLLKAFGVEFKPNEKLMYEYEHWHHRPPKGKQVLQEMIEYLGFS